MNHGHTAETLRAFEQRTVAAFAAGSLPFLVHLSGGNEEQLLRIFAEVGENDWVLSTHRNHYHALLKGVTEQTLEELIRTGRSMFVFSAEHRFVSSSILAGLCPVACGLALGIQQAGGPERVWCFLGDGAEDNGHFAEAVWFAFGQRLPVTFIVEDNNRQVDTTYAERWGTPTRREWPGNVVHRYFYTPTFPHGGAGLPPGSVKFDPDVVAKFAPPPGF